MKILYAAILAAALAGIAQSGLAQQDSGNTSMPVEAAEQDSVASNVLAEATATAMNRHVLVIPIEGMIERGLLHIVQRALDSVDTNETAAVVLDMDTPGGRVDVTETLMRMLMDLPEDLPTFTFIRQDALSAGALIAVSTRAIYMAPGSRIGASAIVGASGDIEEGDLKEKHVSALVALVRSAAHANGHDPDLFGSMIRRDMQYEIDGETIVPEGQLLTLSDHEAARIVGTNGNTRPLLSKGTVGSIEEMLALANIPNVTLKPVNTTDSERVARWIEQFAFLFLAGGLLGIYIEFRTPGFGIPGIAGIILLAIFFWGHRIAGLSGDWQLVVFIIGALLLLAEIFLIPGFGITGIAGISLMLLAIFFSMAAPLPVPGGLPAFKVPAIDLQNAALQMALSFAVLLAAGATISRYLPKAAGFRRLVLEAELHGTAYDETGDAVQDADPPSSRIAPGAKGFTATDLRPSGYATICGQRVSVMADGGFIEKGQPVIVLSAESNRIMVRADAQQEATSA